MAETHGGRLASVLTADPDFQVGPSSSPSLGSHPNQFSYAFLIEDLERIVFQDSVLDIERQEFGRVVSGYPKRCLGQVVGAEREELGYFGDLVSGKGRT